MSANLFIVPHDFTSVADSALKYALFLAKPRNTSIQLLHVISDESKRESTQKKLDDVIKNLDLSVGSSLVTSKITTGSIFDDIPRIAQEEDARIIIMGTHGAKGMQKLFGSYAIKVISNSNVPFLVIQDGVERDKLENIIVPITVEKESLQVINIAGEIAKTFNSNLHVIAQKESDPGLNQQLKIRISIVKKQYEEKEIEAKISILEGKGSYNNQIMEYARKNNGDLIAVAYDSSNFFQKFTQSLITNEENIPCIVINAKLPTNFFY